MFIKLWYFVHDVCAVICMFVPFCKCEWSESATKETASWHEGASTNYLLKLITCLALFCSALGHQDGYSQHIGDYVINVLPLPVLHLVLSCTCGVYLDTTQNIIIYLVHDLQNKS